MLPKSTFLKVPLLLCSMLGVCPWKFMFQDHITYQKIYTFYSRLVFGVYCLWSLTVTIKFVLLLREEEKQFDEIGRSAMILLLYSVTLGKMLVMKFKPGYNELVQYLVEDEEDLLDESKDQEIIGIFYNDSKVMNSYLVSFAIFTHFMILLLLTRPHVLATNSSRKIFPIPAWVPVDDQKYYFPVLIWNSMCTATGSLLISYTDIAMVPLIVYPSIQLRILNHILRNFERYVTDEDMAVIGFRGIIDRHREIIEYVTIFNKNMNLFMLFDFLLSSIQIASNAVQLQVDTIPLWDYILVGSILIGMVLRFLFYYYNANEVLILSENVPMAIWQSKWYNQSRSVKFMMQIVMLKTRTPLLFHIGPFGFMSLDTFINILKAGYSYITIMRRSKQ